METPSPSKWSAAPQLWHRHSCLCRARIHRDVASCSILDPRPQACIKRRSIPGLLLQTFLIYAVCAFIAYIVRVIVGDSADPWTSTLALQGTMALAAIISINRDSMSAAEVGLKLPSHYLHVGSILAVILINVLGGVILIGGWFPPMPHTHRSLLGNIFWICAFVPAVEEFFVRGWFQTATARALGKTRKKRVILLSAATFSLLHLGWIFRGAPLSTTLIIMLGTFLSGLFFARCRQQSGSIVPPILLHTIYNLTGVLFSAGITWVLTHPAPS